MRFLHPHSSEPNLRVAKMSGAIRALTLASLWLSAADGFRSFSPEPDFSPNVHETDNAQPALSVTSQPSRVLSRRGGNATLPCTVRRDGWPAPDGKMRIKWTKLTSGLLTEVDGLLAKHFFAFFGWMFWPPPSSTREATEVSTAACACGALPLGTPRWSSMTSLWMITEATNVRSSTGWRTRRRSCRSTWKVKLWGPLNMPHVQTAFAFRRGPIVDRIAGVVFPYSPRLGRYNLKFRDAERACREQDGVVASPEQLREAWRRGLDWCNAGWLSDGSVRYPVTSPREPCGGQSTPAGVRSYGPRDKDSSRFDVFCFTSHYKGDFYFLPRVGKLTYGEAAAACRRDGARLATVGHMYAAWKLAGYDRCDAGWLADGSVRYPVARPRPRCSPARPAVGFLGFPDKKHKLYGVYCFGPGRRAARRHRGAR